MPITYRDRGISGTQLRHLRPAAARPAREAEAFLYGFDLLELDGKDLMSQPLEARKKALERLLQPARDGIRYVDHLDFDDGAVD